MAKIQTIHHNIPANLDAGNVSIWFRDRWSPLAAIVSTDFFLGNNIVDLAIQENQRRYAAQSNIV